jgi:hypothetical protein
METLIDYIIKSVLVSGLLLFYYHGVLRNRKFHSFNRVYLLSVLLASLVLPLVRPPWSALPWMRLHKAGSQPLDGLITGVGSHPAAKALFPAAVVAPGLCVAISAGLLLVLAVRILALYRLKRRNPSQRIEGCHFIEIKDRRAPFSFQ